MPKVGDKLYSVTITWLHDVDDKPAGPESVKLIEWTVIHHENNRGVTLKAPCWWIESEGREGHRHIYESSIGDLFFESPQAAIAYEVKRALARMREHLAKAMIERQLIKLVIEAGETNGK